MQKVVEASTVVPLGPEETWDLLFGDQMQRAVEAIENVISVENYQMRADGTPRYTMVRKVGRLTMSTISDYSVYERPYRTVSRASDPDAPFGGTFYTTHEPVSGGGTRLSFRMEVEPQNSLAALMLPVIRPLFARQLQQDLEDLSKAATTPQQGDQQRQEEGATSGMGLGGGALAVGAVILALYLLLRLRRGASRRR